MSVGPPPVLARSTATFAASKTASTSFPSTVNPGIAYDAARSEIFSTFMLFAVEKLIPYLLFSQTKMTGRFQTDARLSAS